MTVRINKQSINLREKLSELDKPSGLTGEELLRSGTSSEARDALDLEEHLFEEFESTGIDDNATSTAITIDSNENVGIGTSSPSGALDVGGQNILNDNYNGIGAIFRRNGTHGAVVALGRQGLEDGVTLDYPATNTLGFSTGGSERMRLDSSGNLLVGKTTTGSGVDGFSYVASASATQLSRTSGDALSVNRNSTDGDIAVFRKDGTTVGSIGSFNGLLSYMVLDTRANGAGIIGTTDAIAPVTETGALANGTKSLGNSSIRWKDLYLSGGVNFGGTGGAVASKTLDDYEEGTWTGALKEGANTIVSVNGTYTKVGNRVDITWYRSFVVSNSNNGLLTMTGLPFASVGFRPVGAVHARMLGTGVNGLTAVINGSTVEFRQLDNLGYQSNVYQDEVLATNGTSSDFFMFSVTYFTS